MIVVVEAEFFVDVVGWVADVSLLKVMSAIELGHFYQHIPYVVEFLQSFLVETCCDGVASVAEGVEIENALVGEGFQEVVG